MSPQLRPLRCAIREAGQRALIVVLCFTAWRGPLPWVHEHYEAGADAIADARLTRHLWNYHAGQDVDDHHWHLHFAVIWHGIPDEDRDSQSGDEFDLVLTPTASPGGAAAVQVGIASVTLGWMDCEVASPADAPTDNPGEGADSFLGTLLLAAPLRAVTGVALC